MSGDKADGLLQLRMGDKYHKRFPLTKRTEARQLVYCRKDTKIPELKLPLEIQDNVLCPYCFLWTGLKYHDKKRLYTWNDDKEEEFNRPWFPKNIDGVKKNLCMFFFEHMSEHVIKHPCNGSLAFICETPPAGSLIGSSVAECHTYTTTAIFSALAFFASVSCLCLAMAQIKGKNIGRRRKNVTSTSSSRFSSSAGQEELMF
ncbi:hypothetical protein RRG08_037573 [Elysia crispata]|uniref:C-type lectin domain-containing protein n=1 Tax=Elysia crispata TaxID=231223 RepID=A0AAE1B5J6_9GAST|nr:hypothetical protein RRG08_037573 [Elysia crispata]